MRRLFLSPRPSHVQRGLSLVLVLMMLAVVLLLALAAAGTALLSEKAARNDRDRQQALHAAEAALLDAEADILLHAAGPRRDVLAGRAPTGLPAGVCGSGSGNPLRGLCVPGPAETMPVWQSAQFVDPAPDGAGVPYGHFTSRIFPHGAGPLPIQPPRYVIELPDSKDNRGKARLYRITAVGFGARQDTQVVLQSWFRVAAGKEGGDRLAWREITDWRSDEQNER